MSVRSMLRYLSEEPLAGPGWVRGTVPPPRSAPTSFVEDCDLASAALAPGRSREPQHLRPVRLNHPLPVGNRRPYPVTEQQRLDARDRRCSAAVGAVACTGFGALLTLIVQAVS